MADLTHRREIEVEISGPPKKLLPHRSQVSLVLAQHSTCEYGTQECQARDPRCHLIYFTIPRKVQLRDKEGEGGMQQQQQEKQQIFKKENAKITWLTFDLHLIFLPLDSNYLDLLK